jgi:hypothetical protein
MTDPIKLAIEALESSADCIQAMTDGPHRGDWGDQLDTIDRALGVLRAQPSDEVCDLRNRLHDANQSIRNLEANLRAQPSSLPRLNEIQKLDIVTNWFSDEDCITRAMGMLTDFEQTTPAQPSLKEGEWYANQDGTPIYQLPVKNTGNYPIGVKDHKGNLLDVVQPDHIPDAGEKVDHGELVKRLRQPNDYYFTDEMSAKRANALYTSLLQDAADALEGKLGVNKEGRYEGK